MGRVNTIPGLGQRVRVALAHANMNQRQASLHLGIGRETLQRMIHEDAAPVATTLVALAKHTGVSLDWLCGLWEGGMDPAPIVVRRRPCSSDVVKIS